MVFNKAAYDIEYARKHVRTVHLTFNDTNPSDMALLSYLSSKPNRNAYIKGLILEEMNGIRCQNGCQIGKEDSETVDE